MNFLVFIHKFISTSLHWALCLIVISVLPSFLFIFPLQICINAWIWSVVFHARDTPWTERLDYFCAFSMVLFSLFGLVIRYGREEWYFRWQKGDYGSLKSSCIILEQGSASRISHKHFDHQLSPHLQVSETQLQY